jgi:hypothetical protein
MAGKEREDKRETRITREDRNENAAEGVCLSMRPSWAFYIGVSVCRYKIELVDCDTSVLSKFEIKMI